MRNLSVTSLNAELRGGFASALQGLATTVGPILLFIGLFGPVATSAGLWATLVTASVVHVTHLLLRSHTAILPSSRVASLTAFAALVLQMAQASGATASPGTALSPEQFQIGLLAASVMFFVASLLVLLTGVLRLGHVVKMIPTPVVSGISNGTALVLIWLALQQMVHGVWGAAITGTSMAVVYLLWPRVQQRLGPLRHLPGVVVAPLVGIALARLLEPAVITHATSAMPLDAAWIAVLHWGNVPLHDTPRMLVVGLPGIVTLALVMVLETFTAIGVMESRHGVRVDANRELMALGGANMASALLGGVPSTGSQIRSVASWTEGGRGLAASVSCMLIAVALLVGFMPWLMALPAGIVAGLFLMQAFLMIDPRFASQLAILLRLRKRRTPGAGQVPAPRKFNHAFWLTLGIALVTFLGNLIWASFLGIAVSCLVVLRRLSGRLTARWAYLDQYRSRRMRTPPEDEALASNPHAVAVLRLGGHLFFGNSLRLTQLSDELHPDAQCAVVDVSMVGDVDPSAMEALTWLLKDLQRKKISTQLCGLARCRSLELQLLLQNFQGVGHSLDMDRGLEFCEDLMLAQAGARPPAGNRVPLEHNRLLAQLDPDELTAVLLLGEVREVPQGATLFLRDAPAEGVWLLEEGRVSILASLDAQAPRLATFGAGQFVGEMGFIDGKARSATGIADTPVRALLIDNNAMAALRERHPLAVIKISVNIARELSQRVRNTSALLADRNTEESSVWEHSAIGASSRF